MVTILIVDDNASFRNQAARLCDNEGFATLTAGNLSELSAVLSRPVAPDLVLIDIELPDIPGHRLGSLIRSRHNVPILLVSALAEDRVRRLFETSDANGWICKPLTRDKLIAAVSRFVTATPAAARRSTAVPPPPPRKDPSLPRVLLIEDEPLIATRIESMLEAGAATTAVVDGDTAIQCLLAHEYDCILLDLTLPHLSGFDVLRHLMMHRPAMLRRTVIMTGASDESLQFIDPGTVAGVLRKPFALGELTDIVEQVTRPSS